MPPRRPSTIARLLVVLLGLTLAPLVAAPAVAAPSLTASPSNVPVGGTTKISGTIAKGPRVVQLQRKVLVRKKRKWRIAWSTVARTTSARDGSFVATVKPPWDLGSYTYRALAPRKRGAKKVISQPISIQVVAAIPPPSGPRITPLTAESAQAPSAALALTGKSHTYWNLQGLTSVECRSEAFCVFATNTGKVAINTGGGTLQSAQLGAAGIEDISCPSTTFCLAINTAGESYSFNGTGWWGPISYDAGHTPASVSCASTSLCVAVDLQGFSSVHRNGVWGPAQAIPLGPTASTHFDISCASNARCLAANGFAFMTFDASTGAWGGPYSPGAPIPGQPTRRGSLTSVSCGGTVACLIAHTAGQMSAVTEGATRTTDYGSAQSIEPLAKAITSCASDGDCALVDNLGLLHDVAISGGTAAPVGVGQQVVAAGAFPVAMSCPSKKMCMVVATDGLHRITTP